MDLSFKRFCMTSHELKNKSRPIKLIPKNAYFPEDFFKEPTL